MNDSTRQLTDACPAHLGPKWVNQATVFCICNVAVVIPSALIRVNRMPVFVTLRDALNIRLPKQDWDSRKDGAYCCLSKPFAQHAFDYPSYNQRQAGCAQQISGTYE